MDQGRLTAKSTDSSYATLTLKVNESLSILAGGVLQCSWLVVESKTISVESSGSVSADGSGNPPTTGIGATSGMHTSFDRSNGRSLLRMILYHISIDQYSKVKRTTTLQFSDGSRFLNHSHQFFICNKYHDT